MLSVIVVQVGIYGLGFRVIKSACRLLVVCIATSPSAGLQDLEDSCGAADIRAGSPPWP